MSILVIIPYFNRPLSCIERKVKFYASLNEVGGVQIIEFDEGKSAQTLLHASDKVHVVHRPNDLRHRFVSEHPCNATFTLICDDDILPEKQLLTRMLKRITENECDMVGPYGRQIDKFTQHYLSRQSTDADIVLTKLFIAKRVYVDKIGCVVRDHGDYLGARCLNAEDIVFCLLWIHFIGNKYCIDTMRNEIKDEHAQLGGLCQRRNHLKERSEAVRTCLSRCIDEYTQTVMHRYQLSLIHNDPLNMKHMATEIKPSKTSKSSYRTSRLQRRKARLSQRVLPQSHETYWCNRYDNGGDSGRRSYGISARMRGKYISTYVKQFNVHTLFDLGCGDTFQQEQIHVPMYYGCDVSPTVLQRHMRTNTRSFLLANKVPSNIHCDCILLMDVLHCITDDVSFTEVISSVFTHPSASIVMIISKDINYKPASHICYRKFLDVVNKDYREWELLEIVHPCVLVDDLFTFVRTREMARIKRLRVDNLYARARVIQQEWRKNVLKNSGESSATMLAVNEWPTAQVGDYNDRKLRTQSLLTTLLAGIATPTVLDIGGKDYEGYARANGWLYHSIDLDVPQGVGTGKHQKDTTYTYDGKTLPFSAGSYDLILLSFVLHHASENTLTLLKQCKQISRQYVIVGEDVAAQDYPMKWHERNWVHHPGGIFRSDEEWRQLFELLGFKTREIHCIRRADDIDSRFYRMLYVIKTA